MNRLTVRSWGPICLVSLCAWLAIGQAAIAEPRPKSVRIIYLVSADRSVREDFRKGIETAAKDLQRWYGKQLGGPTFRLNDPVVEVVKSDKDAKWFYSHPNGENQDDWGFNNGLAEARRLVGARHGDPQYVWVIYSVGEAGFQMPNGSAYWQVDAAKDGQVVVATADSQGKAWWECLRLAGVVQRD